jgi:DNA gyrase/topoisomerase IV subunit B
MSQTLDLQYQKKQHIDHIYDLPDTYTGSIEMTDQNMYVLNAEKNAMILENIKYVPGFFKIFDEILVNALDHRQRDLEVKNIKVAFNLGKSEISIWNDGKGIDVEKHPVYNDYIIEMLFGQLLTSSNYEKDTKRTTGGKNGYGAKLTNIFSKKFKIETVDATRRKKYIQIFEDNMKTRNEPIISSSNQKPYTCITFLPDYDKFECIDGITLDIYKLFEKRVLDLAGICPDDMNIYLNNEKIKCKNFEKYIDFYIPENIFKIVDDKNERWKVGIALSPNQSFNEVSFVNGIWTMKGGKHTEYVLSQIMDKIKDFLQKNIKTRNKNIKNSVIKDQIWLFVNCILENPSFTSQTKEECSSKISQFGSKWECNEKFIEKFIKSGFLDRILETCIENEEKNMKKSDGNKKSIVRIPKLEDANYAGGKKSLECTLILTEGDSAKTSALSGLSVQGPSFRDYYGVFPLKGKFLNVRDASNTQILNNEEVKNLKKILGLQQGKEYTKDNINELRYGSVSLMTDQDSVTGDTPIIYTTDKLHINIIYIQDIIPTHLYFKLENGKQIGYPSEKIYVWTNDGWSEVLKVIRHLIPKTKKIFRVVTNFGIVDVTEDHSLLDEYENKISPKMINFQDTNLQYTKLLYSFPNHMCLSKNKKIKSIKYEYNKYNAQISYIYEKMSGNQVTLDYSRENKNYILYVNCNESTKMNQINENSNQENSNEDNENSNQENSNAFCIIDIYEIEHEEIFVYDLETANHKFQAGIGELIVHNTDGSHIKGLVLNFFHHFFPSLLRIDGFLKTYITPIVRGFKGKETINFYTLSDYEKFKKENENLNWNYKYYKGLGTSSRNEMQEYFQNMNEITINYQYDPKCDYDINMAFKKTMAQQRKDWLKVYNPNETIVYEKGQNNKIITLDDFIHKDLKHFSNADNIRSIPNLMDGFKPSQRKVLYGTMLKCGSQNNSIKVAQLSGFISEKTCYHHGEISLEQTIVNMSQKFVGKNNINWLEPLGMFGTRLSGGKDHASSRYIFTKMNDISFKTFRKEDTHLLEYLDDDGEQIEPKIFFPILPVILMNGTEGIGTGYSTYIPSFHPLEIADACIHYAKFGNLDSFDSPFIPWYDGFKGKIYKKCENQETQNQETQNQQTENKETENEENPNFNLNFNHKVTFITEGLLEVKQDSKTEYKIIITELPIGFWTDSFKDFLDEQIQLYQEFKQKKKKISNNEEKDKPKEEKMYKISITNYINKSTDKDVYFECIIEKDQEKSENWIQKFKLSTNICISNMYLYVNNELYKFNSVQEIILQFCKERLVKYVERKKLLLKGLEIDLIYLANKIRFLEMVINGSLIIFKKKKELVIKEMEILGFVKKENSFDYCVKMPIETFTYEKILELKNEENSVQKKYLEMSNISENQIWINEIDEWKNMYNSKLRNNEVENTEKILEVNPKKKRKKN